MIKKKQNDNAEFRKNYPKAFIVEDVSKTRQNIMFKLRKDDSYAHVWSIQGKIKLLKKGYTDTDTPITITTPYDLKKLGWSPKEIEDTILAE